MDTAIKIIEALIFAVIPHFKSKYFLRPELTIEVNSKEGISLALGSSRNNDFSNGSIEADTAILIFEIIRKFEIVITNNSDQIAFYPIIECDPNGLKFTQLEKLNKFHSIKPTKSIILKAEYRKLEHATGRNRTPIEEIIPPEFCNLALLLGYENSKKRRFFTQYSHSVTDPINEFLRAKPGQYKKN